MASSVERERPQPQHGPQRTKNKCGAVWRAVAKGKASTPARPPTHRKKSADQCGQQLREERQVRTSVASSCERKGKCGPVGRAVARGKASADQCGEQWREERQVGTSVANSGERKGLNRSTPTNAQKKSADQCGQQLRQLHRLELKKKGCEAQGLGF